MKDVEKKNDMLMEQKKTDWSEVEEREFCLGKVCPNKNCRICPAAKNARFVLDVTDSYRRSVQNGYYTSTIMQYKDPITGETKYCYTRPD